MSKQEFVELQHEYEVPDEELYSYHKITSDPFDFRMETEDVQRCKAAIRQAIRRGRMLCVVGDVGAGKTTLLDMLAGDPELKLIRADFLDQYMISPQALTRLMIRALRYDDKFGKISRNPELQQYELGNLLHQHRMGGETIVLALDDGQQFRTATLRILKRLREIFGRKQLFEVLVLTHRSGVQKIRETEEAGRRFLFRDMKGFTLEELKSYVTKALRHLFAGPEVVDEFCKSMADRRPLVIQGLLLQALERVMIRGAELIETQDIEAGLSLGALVKRFDISLSLIAQRASAGKSTVSAVLAGNYKGRTEKVNDILAAAQEAVQDKQKERREGTVRQAMAQAAGE